MPLFEIFIPSLGATGLNITARVRAESWIQALKSGLARLGDTTDVHDILCDINETGIDVTEPKQGRVFRIREIPDVQAPAVAKIAPGAKVVSGPPPKAPTQAAAKVEPVVRLTNQAASLPVPAVALTNRVEQPAQEPVVLTNQKPKPKPAIFGRAPVPANAVAAAPRAAPVTPAAPVAPIAPAVPPKRFQAVVEEESVVQEQATVAPAVPIGRAAQAPEQSFEDLVAHLMEAIQDIYSQPNLTAACGFVLDLAMRHIPCESGSVLISDINRNDLFFAVARGPKAEAVMKYRVTMGQGIVGFCAQEGVALAVSDVQRDPRFYAAISQAIGYETSSIICAPAQQQGRVFGAIELINKTAGNRFSGDEVAILNFLAHELAEYLMTNGPAGG